MKRRAGLVLQVWFCVLTESTSADKQISLVPPQEEERGESRWCSGASAKASLLLLSCWANSGQRRLEGSFWLLWTDTQNTASVRRLFKFCFFFFCSPAQSHDVAGAFTINRTAWKLQVCNQSFPEASWERHWCSSFSNRSGSDEPSSSSRSWSVHIHSWIFLSFTVWSSHSLKKTEDS